MYSPESSVKEVTNTYDDIAAEYDDRIFGADSTFEAHRKERVFTETELEFLLSKISVKDRVLELGCGTGRVTIPIARKAACVTAVDISQSMLKVACEKAHAASVSHKISFLQQDMTSLSLPPESFSTVVSSLALMHIPRMHRNKVFSECYKVLRPKGKMIIAVKNKKFEEISSADLFGRGDSTNVETNEIVFADTRSGKSYQIEWNSFSYAELQRLFVENGFTILEVRGNIPLLAWLDNKILDQNDSLVEGLIRLEKVLANVPLLNHLGYYNLVEAIKVV